MIEAITSAYVAMRQTQLQQDAGMAVLKQGIDTAATQGDQLTRMITSAGPSSIQASDAQIQQGLAITDPTKGNAVDLFV